MPLTQGIYSRIESMAGDKVLILVDKTKAQLLQITLSNDEFHYYSIENEE